MTALDPTFEWLLATTLRASALAAIILITQLMLRRWLPASWRYALWLPMLLVMVLPALPSVPFGWALKHAVEAPTVMAAPAPVAIVDPILMEAVKEPAPAIKEPAAPKLNPLPLLWLLGASAVFGAGLIGYRRNMRRIIKSSAAPDKNLLRSITMAAQEAGVARMPRVLVSPMVASPAVTGVFRPLLLLPARFPEGFSEAETRLILLHEFSHLKRHDLVVNGLSCVLQALHWFNPLIWLAFSRMRADREAACDAQVLSIGTVDHRVDYGNALLKLQSGSHAYGLSLGFVGIFERSTGMKSRIREIAGHRPAGTAGRTGGAGIVALLLAFGATKAQEPTTPKAPAETAARAKKPPTPGQIAIDRKLDAIIIPRVDFENTALEEGIDFLRLRAVELDGEPNPTRKGVNFVLLLPASTAAETFKPERIERLQRRNTTLREILNECCQLTGMEFRVEDSGVIITSAGMENGLKAVESTPAPAGPAADFATKVIIPRINFEDVTLQEAVDSLNETIRKLAKGAKVFPITLDPTADPAARIRELRVRNVPLSVALKYCGDSTNHIWTADDKAIVILLKPGARKMAPKQVPALKAAQEFANKTIIPRANFENTTLKEAVDFLNESARTSAKGGAVFPIVLDPGADPATVIRELRISTAPLTVVLQYCTEATKHTWKADDQEIRILRK